jgi:hypothetical protein
MTLEPIVPARPCPRPARCAELIDARRPTHQSPPDETDFGPSHDVEGVCCDVAAVSGEAGLFGQNS